MDCDDRISDNEKGEYPVKNKGQKEEKNPYLSGRIRYREDDADGKLCFLPF